MTVGRQSSARGGGGGISLGSSGQGPTGPATFGLGRSMSFSPMGMRAPIAPDMSKYLTGHNPRTDGTMNQTDALNAGSTITPWAPSSGAGPGTRGYRGGGIIGSAAGALGSGGMPTSQRGRLEKFGVQAAGMPSWAAAQLMRNYGGLSQSQRYGSMGGLPPEVAQAPQGNGAGVPAAGAEPEEV